MYIYSNCAKNAILAFYLMGILWVWYGYPMERIDISPCLCYERILNCIT